MVKSGRFPILFHFYVRLPFRNSLTVLVKTSQAPSLFQFSLSFAWQCFISCLGAALHRDVYISQDQILQTNSISNVYQQSFSWETSFHIRGNLLVFCSLPSSLRHLLANCVCSIVDGSLSMLCQQDSATKTSHESPAFFFQLFLVLQDYALHHGV